jgi:hypothetical protein
VGETPTVCSLPLLTRVPTGTLSTRYGMTGALLPDTPQLDAGSNQPTRPRGARVQAKVFCLLGKFKTNIS